MHVIDSAGLENEWEENVTDPTMLYLTVMDINDHHPVFNPDYYKEAVNGIPF